MNEADVIVTTLEVRDNDTSIGADVSMKIYIDETTKQFNYSRGSNTEIFCGGEIGIL